MHVHLRCMDVRIVCQSAHARRVSMRHTQRTPAHIHALSDCMHARADACARARVRTCVRIRVRAAHARTRIRTHASKHGPVLHGFPRIQACTHALHAHTHTPHTLSTRRCVRGWVLLCDACRRCVCCLQACEHACMHVCMCCVCACRACVHCVRACRACVQCVCAVCALRVLRACKSARVRARIVCS